MQYRFVWQCFIYFLVIYMCITKSGAPRDIHMALQGDLNELIYRKDRLFLPLLGTSGTPTGPLGSLDPILRTTNLKNDYLL